MHRKLIICQFRNGDFGLLFISIFFNNVYGWTAQNSVFNSRNFAQRIFFELLYRVYKSPKLLGYVLFEGPSMKYVPSKFWVLYTLYTLAWIPFWWTLSQKRAYAFLIQSTKKILRRLFSLVPYLRKGFSLTFFFYDSHVKADNPRGQCVKHNIFLSTCWDNFFYHHSNWNKAQKCALTEIFLNIYQKIPKHIQTTIRIMQKCCFAVEFWIRISNRIPCVNLSSNEVNFRDGVILTWIWIPGRTFAVKVWLKKSAT